jgi:YVTN family beta-propeller protein
MLKIHARFFLFLLLLFFIAACKKWIDPPLPESTYPEAVEKILVNKCTSAGCHNQKDYLDADELNLSTWSSLFEGAEKGAVVVPYSTEQSPLLQYINTYADIGLSSEPAMPLNGTPLTREEVLTIKNWIQEGCPNKNKEGPFPNYASRKKIYISNQGCDLVSVIDAETHLVMRYIKVGHEANITELPHNIQSSSDGKYWYVCFVNGTYFQKYDADTDELVKEVNIGTGSWNVIKLSNNNEKAYLSDFSTKGKLVTINLNTMTVQSVISGAGILSNPHGIATSPSADTIYITAQFGNMVYRLIPATSSLEKISLQKNQAPVTTPQLLDPHQIKMSEHGKYYFVTCQASNEVRVMDAKMDTLVKIISVGKYPLEMAVAKNKNLLFVTCQEDPDPINSVYKGSVYAINMNTFLVEHVIYQNFYQPHGITVDDTRNLLYVASRNADPNGPAPHHISTCGGRNGYYTIIDLNTYEVIKSGIENFYRSV